MAGKTGWDAVSRAIDGVCRTIQRYRNKLHALIVLAQAATIITADEATKAHAFVEDASNLCSIFQKLAEYNSITP